MNRLKVARELLMVARMLSGFETYSGIGIYNICGSKAHRLRFPAEKVYPIIGRALKRKARGVDWKYLEIYNIHYSERDDVWSVWGIALDNKTKEKYNISFYRVNPKALLGLNWPVVKIEKWRRGR